MINLTPLAELGISGIAALALYLSYRTANGVIKNNTLALEKVSRAIRKMERAISQEHRAILEKLKGGK